ncbi:restriction endonuclease subunit M [Candidatus Pacearchaeota archaeon CG1_02_32_21]|nr:MAG: restriction endonuclease subunit M [Candidatus Pacearchaeota archaeon CG1_02_32_21]
MNSPANTQIKSKTRVSDHGEVFTHEREVNGMLDLVKNETERLDSRFLEPACGDGNFLVEILNRKLVALKQKYVRSQIEYEKYGVIVISSLYGIDLLEDNVEECRERLLKIFEKEYISIFKHEINKDYIKVLKFILSKNIVGGDALTMKDNKGNPLIFSEWSMPYNDSKIKRKEYSFKDIFSPTLLWSFSTDSDTGERVILPNVYKDHQLMNYMELANNE